MATQSWAARQRGSDRAYLPGKPELGQVQADELYTKTQAGPVWIATVMAVFSRLWLWGAIGWERDEHLIEQVVVQVRAAAAWGGPLLWAVDGFRAYPKAILSVFRDPLYTGKVGRPRLAVWDDLHIVQVIKHRVGKRLMSITRRVAYGCLERAEDLMQASQVLLGMITTASPALPLVWAAAIMWFSIVSLDVILRRLD